ncbi:hypothetical protein [Coxiella-like endosymbiont]|uniref:hypothetical protein n=1 Tax=Coxiella-like endosymbiont TaxID=1592897 RepID=UPI002868AB95|nr:hypothetical protein [Coxiella-like endosymbiont]
MNSLHEAEEGTLRNQIHYPPQKSNAKYKKTLPVFPIHREPSYLDGNEYMAMNKFFLFN